MILDSLGYYYVCKELDDELKISRLTKIRAFDNYTFEFSFYSIKKVKKLIVDLTYGNQVIFFTKNSKISSLIKKNDKTPHIKNFVIVLKNIIKNENFCKISTYDYDRVIFLKLKEHTVVFEMMGKTSNIILFNNKDSIIKAACKYQNHQRRGGTKGKISKGSSEKLFNQERTIYPGVKYEFPKNEKKVFNKDILKKPMNSRLFSKFNSKLFTCLEINSLEKLLNSDKCFVYIKKNKIKSFFPFYINNNEFNIIEFPSFNEAIDNFYFEEKNKIKEDTQVSYKLKILQKKKEKVKKNLLKVKDSKIVKENIEEYYSLGQLLKTYAHSVEDGQDKVKVYDFDGIEKIIKLRPDLTVEENMQLFFKLYKKHKKRLEYESSKKKELLKKLELIENDIKRVLNGENVSVEEKNQKQKREKIYKSVYKTEFKETKIYVGKSADDNDFLLSKIAKGNFLWLHAQNLKGGHVIVCRDYREIPSKLLKFAAKHAAVNSGGKNDDIVPVDYTACKYVKKIKGVKGKVTFSSAKTIFVKI
ncbi:MAG: NFACT RNA binding domain-containing protein [Candidatus Muiribacteriota bacterium]